MSAGQITERARSLILDHLKKGINVALDSVRDDRQDPMVSMEYPQHFFIYDGAHTYRMPAIFLVADSIEFPDDRLGANHVNATLKMYASAVVEGRDAHGLTIKVERYQAALFDLLHRTTLQDDIKGLKVYVRVLRCQFSPLYTKKVSGSGESQFRKEASLELEIKHFENPTS